MKKGTKTALWAAAGCIAAGVLLLGIGAAAGGSEEFRMDKLFTWNGISRWSGEEEQEGEAVLDGDFFHSVEWTGAFHKDLKVELGVHALEIVEGGDSAITLEGHLADRIQCYVKDGELCLQDVGKNKKFVKTNNKRHVLTVPAGTEWEEAELTAELSNISKDTLQAGDVSLESDLGVIEIGDLQARRLEAEANMGSIEAAGRVDGDVTVDTDMGSVRLSLQAKPEDFDYEIRTGMGSITVGGQDYSGMDREKIVENGSDRKMKLDSSMGSIEILWESR